MRFICLMYFAYAYGLYFYITWLPTYLIEARGFSIGSTKWLASLPWTVSLVGYWFGGWITDRLAKTAGGLKLARCGVGAIGYTLSALFLLAVALTSNNLLAAILLAIAFCLQAATTAAAWSVCLDIGHRNAGVVTGVMNTFGNIGGAIAPVVVGYAVKDWHSWTAPFYIMAGLFLFGALMWLMIDPKRTLHVEA